MEKEVVGRGVSDSHCVILVRAIVGWRGRLLEGGFQIHTVGFQLELLLCGEGDVVFHCFVFTVSHLVGRHFQWDYSVHVHVHIQWRNGPFV